MVVIQSIIFGVTFLSLGVFVVLFGALPKFKNTPIGWAYRLVMVWIPGLIARLDNLITGGFVVRSTKRTFNYLLFDKHPLIKYFYLILVTGGIYVFYIGTWEHLWSVWHKLGAIIVCSLPYITMHLASSSDPGIITDENHNRSLKLYPFDYAIYHPGKHCRTCHFEKPARSKHCSICKRCISRHDHHCVWINNCVGHNNTQHFIYFLMATNVMLVYGAYLTGVIMNAVIEVNLPTTRRWRDLGWSDYANLWLLAMTTKTWTALICLLTSMCSLMSIGFTGYHLYLIWAGYTTNETMKWTDMKDDINYREAYIAKLPDQVKPIFNENLPLSMGNWPKYPDKIVKRVVNEEDHGRLDDELDWTEVESMQELENVYDIGFWRGLRLVMRPTKV